MGDFPTIRYGPPDEALIVDLLARLGAAFTFDDLETQTVMVEGVRPIDRADAAALREKFGLGGA